MSFFELLSDAAKSIPLTAVLRERLALAAEKYDSIERELSQRKIEKQLLESENRELRSEIQRRTARIHELEKATQESRSARRAENDEKLMLLLINGNTRNPRQFVEELALSYDRVKVILESLKAANLICNPASPHGNSTKWGLTDEGRQYLADHELI